MVVIFWFSPTQKTNNDTLLSQVVLSWNYNIKNNTDIIKVQSWNSTSQPNQQVQEQIDNNIAQYELETLDQSDVRELFAKTSSNTRELNSVEVMEYVYSKTKDEDLLRNIIKSLVQQYRMDDAYKYIKDYKASNYSITDPHTAMYILLNSELVQVNKPEWLQFIKNTLDNYVQQWLITADDWYFYWALISLSNNNLDQFTSLERQIKDPKYAAFQADVEYSIKIWLNRQDLPPYYLNALLSLDIMEYGYFKLAQQIAVKVLLEDDGYDLPYQVLAYSHFVLNNRDRAIEYLHILLEQETDTYQENYKLLLGIAYFWNGDIANSVLYLSQLPSNHNFRADILRYLIQSYYSLWDAKNIVQSYQLLLANPQIEANDYYNFFENVLYKPLVQRTEFSIVTTNEFLVSQYIQTCNSRLNEKEKYICEYGQAWLLLYQNKLDEAAKILESLTAKVEKSYIFAALWDYYYRWWQVAKAQESYTKAVALAVDEKLKEWLQQKLIGILTKE